MFLGFGYSLMFMPCVVIVGEYFDKKRAIAMPIAASGVCVFVLLLPFLLRYFIAYYGWRGCLILQSGIALQALYLAVLFRPPPKEFTKSLKDSISETMESIECQDLKSRSYSRDPLNCKRISLHSVSFLLIFLSNILWNMGSFTLLVLIVDFAIESGVSREQGALLIAAVGMSGAVGRSITAMFAQCVNRLHMFIFVTIISGLAISAVPVYTVFNNFLIMSTVFGCCYGFQVSLQGVLTVDLFGVENLNNVYGLFTLSYGIGAVIGPPVTGTQWRTTT